MSNDEFYVPQDTGRQNPQGEPIIANRIASSEDAQPIAELEVPGRDVSLAMEGAQSRGYETALHESNDKLRAELVAKYPKAFTDIVTDNGQILSILTSVEDSDTYIKAFMEEEEKIKQQVLMEHGIVDTLDIRDVEGRSASVVNGVRNGLALLTILSPKGLWQFQPGERKFSGSVQSVQGNPFETFPSLNDALENPRFKKDFNDAYQDIRESNLQDLSKAEFAALSISVRAISGYADYVESQKSQRDLVEMF